MRAIELFGCAGGMAEGFRLVGVTFDLVFDKDPDACASYEANHGHRPIQMDVRDLLRMIRAGCSLGAIDLLVADPPCTPWSRAGKRLGTSDERDMLEETCELIALLRPSAYLIGNVPGLNDATQWSVVQRLIGGLQKYGYCVADYAELDAAAYGVPQCRIRPFWFGHLTGPCMVWPAPTHGKPTSNLSIDGYALKPYVTCRQALQHLPPEELGRPVRLRWRDGVSGNDHRPSRADLPGRTITRNTHSDGALLLNEKHRPFEVDEPAKVIQGRDRCQGGMVMRVPQGMRVGTGDASSAAVIAKPSRVGGGAGHVLDWPWDRPSTTVTRDERIPPPGHHDSNSYLSEPNAIVLSEKAATILQGFPPDWQFIGKTKKARWNQLGQAMPPPLSEAVARAIVEQMARAKSEEAA